MTSHYEEVSFSDLKDILDYLLKLRLPEENENEFWSFRGQRDSSWSLDIEPHDLSMPMPNKKIIYDDWFSQYKKRMLSNRKFDYLKDANPWWWLFYAKHHGLYTRLLDWTSNPLVAIYFAVENILYSKGDNPEGAVWALKVNNKHFRTAEDLHKKYKLKPNSANLFVEKEWFMINPDPITPRIAAQSGKFTYHPGRNLPSHKPTPIDQMPRRPGERLIKIRIDKGSNDKIRKMLGIMNIHHATLFPSPTGIAYFVNTEWPDIAKY